MTDFAERGATISLGCWGTRQGQVHTAHLDYGEEISLLRTGSSSTATYVTASCGMFWLVLLRCGCRSIISAQLAPVCTPTLPRLVTTHVSYLSFSRTAKLLLRLPIRQIFDHEEKRSIALVEQRVQQCE